MPRRYAGLTAKQSAFVWHFVYTHPGHKTKAAAAAGYPEGNAAKSLGWRLTNNPKVLDAIREESQRALDASVALGRHVIEDLASNARSESVRLQAAQALLDRGGMTLAHKVEHQHTHTHEIAQLSTAELQARIARRAKELGIAIPSLADSRAEVPALEVIDVQPVEKAAA